MEPPWGFIPVKAGTAAAERCNNAAQNGKKLGCLKPTALTGGIGLSFSVTNVEWGLFVLGVSLSHHPLETSHQHQVIPFPRESSLSKGRWSVLLLSQLVPHNQLVDNFK